MSTDNQTLASAAWLPIDSAPKDGTTILLLVKCEHSPLEDEYPSMTIGSYTDSSEGEQWSFPGWSWEQDCFVEGEVRGAPHGAVSRGGPCG